MKKLFTTGLLGVSALLVLSMSVSAAPPKKIIKKNPVLACVYAYTPAGRHVKKKIRKVNVEALRKCIAKATGKIKK